MTGPAVKVAENAGLTWWIIRGHNDDKTYNNTKYCNSGPPLGICFRNYSDTESRPIRFI